MVCDVFVMRLYKAAGALLLLSSISFSSLSVFLHELGVFGDLEFQATELTPKDAYQVSISPFMFFSLFAFSLFSPSASLASFTSSFLSFRFIYLFQLQIFDTNWERPQLCSNDAQPGLCQVSGMCTFLFFFFFFFFFFFLILCRLAGASRI